MKFSVLMPVYFKEKTKYLDESIKSIIEQTLKPNQIVIIKDGKFPAELNKVIEKYKSKYNNLIDIYEFEKNVGIAKALNKGLSICKYEYIARMDSDDVCKNDRFEKQMNYLQKNTELDILGGIIEEYDEGMNKLLSKREVPKKEENIKLNIKKENPFNHSTVIFKKETILKLGGYKNIKLEDYDLWARMVINNCKMENLNEILVKNRTGITMYKKHSGIKYVKDIIEIENKLYEYKLINKGEYAINLIKRIPLALCPVQLKRFIYPFIRRF